VKNEIKHVLLLRENPILANDLELIVELFNEETKHGMDAHQAQLNAIESVQKLGKAMMEQRTQNEKIEEAMRDPDLIKNGKNLLVYLLKHS
jgi:hypothetical protein